MQFEIKAKVAVHQIERIVNNVSSMNYNYL